MHQLRRPVLLSAALFVLGAPFRGGQWPSLLLVVMLVVLVLDELKPAAYAARAPRWLARPWLGIGGGVVLLLNAIAFAGWNFGQVLWLAGAGLFLHDAWKRGEARHLRESLAAASARSQAPEDLPTGGPGSRRRVFITVGLFFGAFVFGNVGDVPGAPNLGLVWLAALGLVLAQTLWPHLAESLPAPLRRPMLGALASLVFLAMALSIASPTPTFLFWVAATGVFLSDAAERGELGPFEPRLLWRGGGRRLALVGLCFAAMMLSEDWDNTYSVSGYTRSSSSSSTYYNSRGDLRERTVTTTEWVPGSTFGGDTDAWTYAGGLPVLGLLGVLAMLSWKGPGHPLLRRTAPLAVLAPMGLWALSHIVENRGMAARSASSSGYVLEAGGPWWFLIGLVVTGVGVVLQSRAVLPPVSHDAPAAMEPAAAASSDPAR